MRFYYTVNDENFADYMFVEEETFVNAIGWIAEACAEDYWSEHDGWEHNSNEWSNGLTFRIWSKEDNEDADTVFHGKFNVVMEMEPSFHAYG